MLKRLELIGFKSFADRTLFDFPSGITAIVGPNGSGKSNIVDAVRWILGEQSAKSLRGGEMADVIFNGSSSRKSLGMAEVTMTFDNSKRVLTFDTDEVQITRRVYRDGTGEYLINNQLSRLRDIKEMFLGSGAGTSAYSIIEQGRVDGLLQASTRDRRIIFEEAAGISRFKAKKIETLRKLENVQQTLARVRDIVAEVEKQRRRLDIEASKARRYQEHSTRLRTLRIGLGLRDFSRLIGQLTTDSMTLEALRAGVSQTLFLAAGWENEASALEATLTTTESQLEVVSAREAETRQRIVGLAANEEFERQNTESATKEMIQSRARKLELSGLVRHSSEATDQAETEVHEAERGTDGERIRAAELATLVAEFDQATAVLQRQMQQDRVRQVDLVRQAGTLQTQSESAKSQLDRFYRDREQRRRKSEQKVAELGSVDRVLEELTRTDADLQFRFATVRQSLVERQDEQATLRRFAEAHQHELERLRVHRSELRGRIEILEGLERSQEGLGTGVREVVALLRAEQSQTTPEANALSPIVIGLVADFLNVPREVAPLIDLALGDKAQQFVVRDSAMLDHWLTTRGKPFTGRVSFLPLVPMEPLEDGDETQTADRWVTCDHAELAGLPRQLLGNVRIVASRDTAREMANDPEMQQYRFVTRDGELLDTDGTLTVGTHHSEGGILSRKSELRDLRALASALEIEIGEAERKAIDFRTRIEALDAPIHGLEQEIALLNNQAGDLQTRLVQHREQRSRIDDEISLARAEMGLLEQDIHLLEATWKEAHEKAEQAEHAAQALKVRLEEAEHELRRKEQQRAVHQVESTAAQVALAQREERLAALRSSLRQAVTDLQRGRDELHRLERHEGVLRARVVESQLAMLRCGASLATAYLEKEACEREVTTLTTSRDQDRERRRELVEKLQVVRTESQEQFDQLRKRELEVRDLENARNSLVDRLKEDYQVDLAEEFKPYQPNPSSTLPANGEGANQNPTPALPANGEGVLLLPVREGIEGGAGTIPDIPVLEPWDTEAVNAEVQQLREKIRRLGSVNLDSLNELVEVEARAKDLQTQLDDLSSAQGSLMEIIHKINTDSRKLFTEIYDRIRTHFQELFRKLFGGGMADVVLENPEDVLESGIEIVARPPGKELRSISLLSGGEKTLTAVALLLAIFRAKPSPFCLLDEVDAALDEANTARLGSTLREFLDRSQFIIVTHKKRTMAIADVLYGITMQESGISKQIAVRFEDWPDDKPEAA